MENFAQGLCGEESIVDSIPCIISDDQCKFMVFVNELDVKQFSKSTLLNLVGTAESISPACQQLVFICSRMTPGYKDFKKMFEVIEASRMTKTEIRPLVSQQEDLSQILEQYGFYKLAI